MKFRLLTLLLLITSLSANAEVRDSLAARHWGGESQLIPGRAIVMDEYQRKWQKGTGNFSLGAEVHYSPLPSDSDAFAEDYNYPTLSGGIRYHWDHGVTMHRSPDSAWGLAEEVDYDSRMGNVVSLYGSFTRPFFRTRRWMADYTLSFGTSYSHRKYDKSNNVDDELIGSRWLIYFGAGLHATYRLAEDWGVKAGVEYYHHSNGALNRPNKGANFVGAMLGLVYMPYYKEVLKGKGVSAIKPFQHYWYLNFTVAAGAKTLDEDWQHTQFHTPSTAPDYRKEKFHLYATYALSADVMCRYQRRWASV